MSDPERYDELVRLLRLHTGQMLAYINALVLNWNDAEDLFQETCLVLWQKFNEFEPGTNFLAWALRIADHKVMNFQTTCSRRAAFTARLRDALKADFAERTGDDAVASLAALADCMEKLPHEDRDLATVCYGDGVPVRKAAATINRSPESVHRSLRRIRKWLLDCVHRSLRQADLPASLDCNLLASEDGP